MRLNTTLCIFLSAMALVTLGLIMVYSTSAPTAAREAAQRATRLAEKSGQPQLSAPVSSPVQKSHGFQILQKQVMWAFLGVIGMLMAYQTDYEKLKKYAFPLLILALVMLVLVFVPGIGSQRKGAHRWLAVGGFQFQSSEFAKIALIIYMAKKVTERQNEIRSFTKGFIPCFGILAVFLGIIVIEPDLGATVVIAMIVYLMWYVGGMRMIHLLSVGIMAIPAIVIAIALKPYRLQRIKTFLNPELDPLGSGYQLNQSLISVATGGIFGVGLGKGPQKYFFLSEGYTDFIFAGICEELGLVGALFLIGLYVFFIIQGIRVASRVPDMYGSLLATGITAMIGFQAFINMAVCIGLLPTKGLTLPLISYGGSSLLVNMVAIGILMSVSRYTEIVAKPSRRAAEAYA